MFIQGYVNVMNGRWNLLSCQPKGLINTPTQGTVNQLLHAAAPLRHMSVLGFHSYMILLREGDGSFLTVAFLGCKRVSHKIFYFNPQYFPIQYRNMNLSSNGLYNFFVSWYPQPDIDAQHSTVQQHSHNCTVARSSPPLSA